MIYVTGDTHTRWMERLYPDVFPEQKNMTKEDYVIICGDFGIWDNSLRENYNLDWLENQSFTTLFVAGNHDNYDILDDLPVEQWHGGKVNFLRPSVIHLMRGQVFEIDGRTFFTFGGASSHDIEDGILDPWDPEFAEKKSQLDEVGGWYRINHKSWWERELPTKEEMWEGLKNLAKVDNKVDYIITHSPDNVAQEFLARDYLPDGQIYQKDILTDYLQQIRNTTEFYHWIYGHMHFNKTYRDIRSTCIYEQIIRIV